MSMIRGRKGVSPLIATVVLIGFAVSLGAVIMSWGKTAFEKIEGQPGAEQGNLAWYIGSNIENVCYTDDAISMTVKGEPEVNIKSVFVVTQGKEAFLSNDKIEIPPPGEGATEIRVPYNATKYGEIKQLILGAVDTSIITTAPRCR